MERAATESSKHFCGWIPPSNPLKRRLVLFNVDDSMITSCGPLPERSRPAHAGSCAAPAAPHDQAHRQQPRTEHTPEPFYQPSNMEALRRSIDEMQQGKTVTKTLEELTALEDD